MLEEVLSTETLAIAIKALHLGLPATDQEIAPLKGQLEVTSVRGTDFIEITAKHPSEKEAVRIAEAVAEAFIAQRQRIATERAHLALEAFDDEIQLQVDLVAKQNAKAHESRNEPGRNEAEEMLREMIIKHQKMRALLKVPRTPITLHERAK